MGSNDEALLLEENLPDVPHLQGVDRVALAHTAVEELEAEVLLLDDGFQHRRLHRDVDLVLWDATEPAHQQWLLPRGSLREPVSNLRRASAVIITRADQLSAEELVEQLSWFKKKFPSLLLATARHQPLCLCRNAEETTPLETMRGQPVAAFCGIGNPEAFRITLNSLGVELLDFRTYPDHHNYTREDVQSLLNWAAAYPAGTTILTTQKDWVKLRVSSFGEQPLWAVRVGLEFLSGEAELKTLIEARLLQVQQDTASEGQAA